MPRKSGAMFCYRLYGLIVSCARPLEHLCHLLASDAVNPDITIEFSSSLPLPPSGHSTHWFSSDRLWFKRDGLTCLALDGRTLRVALCQEFDQKWPLFAKILTATGLAAIFHQRGWLPIHCALIGQHNRAFALVGPSGSGKSTLACLAARSGFELHCDDVCLVEPRSTGFVLRPGLARLKLLPDTVEHFDLDATELVPVDDHKQAWQPPAPSNLGPLKLQACFHLLAGSGSVKAYHWTQSTLFLRANLFRQGLLHGSPNAQSSLNSCRQLATTTRCWSLPRWTVQERLDAVTRCIAGD